MKGKIMNSTGALAERESRLGAGAALWLALWRIRRAWFTSLIIGVGMIAAVMLACTLPLYAQVTTTAGTRSVLNATPESPSINLETAAGTISTSSVQQITNTLTPSVRDALRPYLSTPPQFFMWVTSPLPPPNPLNAAMYFTATSMQDAVPHVTLIQGRLPAVCSGACNGPIELAITQQTASALGVHLGSRFSSLLPIYPGNAFAGTMVTQPLSLEVVGIFQADAGNDDYWHGNDFSVIRGQSTLLYQSLVSQQELLSTFDALARQRGSQGLVLSSRAYLSWYYRLDSARVTSNRLDDLINRLNTLQTHINAEFGGEAVHQAPYLAQTYLSGAMLRGSGSNATSPLERYRDRITAMRIPAAILTVQIVGLILFFLSLMAEVLVERQTDAIAVLRSRGASRLQIFASFTAQGVMLGLIALLIGPPLSLLSTTLITQRTLPAQELDALNILSGGFLYGASGALWYALAAVLVCVLTMMAATYRATGMDVLTIRRESARSARLALWQRLYLDVIAGTIALVGYGISQYIVNSNAIDPRTSTLLSAPLSLIAPILLALAVLLAFLRVFPYLLRLCSRLAIRGRGAAPMLALAQMSRAPYQSLRMVMLLAFATAFVIFTLIFTASQAQHTLAVSAYQAGADFSGDIDLATQALGQPSLAQMTAYYRTIPGAISASVGYSGALLTSGTQPLPVELRAVDAATFRQTAIWDEQDGAQSLTSLMMQLSARRLPASSTGPIPAIVDDSLWQALNLSPGARFSLNDEKGQLPFIAIAHVQHIPTINDSTLVRGGGAYTAPAGMLVDYQSYNHVYMKLFGVSVPMNYYWLRSRDDPASLASVRQALTPFSPNTHFFDRRAMLADLQNDPLYLNLVGILDIGAITVLLLALVGALFASWSNARTRLAHFAVLRALGTAPRQVAGVLSWEQGMVYTTGLALGIVFGALLAATVVPELVFTSVPIAAVIGDVSSDEFYVIQHVLPAQIILPLTLGVAVAALLLICIIALRMMVRIVSQPSLNQVLRLNQD
jgi:ABC-type lipoprotein release transport system permease subunit